MLIDNKKLLPVNDYVFKRIFTYTGNEEVTKDFISNVIGRKVQKVNLNVSPILEKDLRDDKIGVLDLKAELDDNVLCNIEMQVVNKRNIEKRLLFYWSKMYSSGIKEGEDYSKLKRTISILIADFELDSLKEIAKYHSMWQIRENDYQKIVLTKDLELHILELPKTVYWFMNENKRELMKDLMSWSKFLINPNKLEEKDMSNKNIKKAKEIYDKLQNDEHEKYLAELREKYILDKNWCIESGREEGREIGKKEIIQKLKDSDISKDELKKILKIIEN